MQYILLTIADSVATITLNRPDKFNAFNRTMALQLHQALDYCAANNAIRAILLTGSGKAFCAGQDLAEVVDPNGPGMNRILNEHFNPIIQRIVDMPKPIVCAVNGVAAGAGANIALVCDVVIAAQGASFIQAFTKIGLIPDSGGTYTLPKLIGYQRASALMLLGDKVTATQAEHMGMVYKVYEDEQLHTTAVAMAQQLAAMPTMAIAYTKQALQAGVSNTITEQLHTEDVLQQQAAATQDFKEGVTAFIEKRKPIFVGK